MVRASMPRMTDDRLTKIRFETQVSGKSKKGRPQGGREETNTSWGKCPQLTSPAAILQTPEYRE